MFKKSLLFVLIFICFSSPVYARTTPEDIINEQIAIYNERVKNYSQINKDHLSVMNQKITALNQKICSELEANMLRQAQILDEFQQRNKGVETESMKNARYWITFAHEAVAYQAAKVYVFSLTSQSNLNTDITNTINQFNGDIINLKNKVIKSQSLLKSTVSGGGNTTPAIHNQGGEG